METLSTILTCRPKQDLCEEGQVFPKLNKLWDVKEDYLNTRKMPNYLVSSILNSDPTVGKLSELDQETVSQGERNCEEDQLDEAEDDEEEDIGLDLTANSGSDLTDFSTSPEKNVGENARNHHHYRRRQKRKQTTPQHVDKLSDDEAEELLNGREHCKRPRNSCLSNVDLENNNNPFLTKDVGSKEGSLLTDQELVELSDKLKHHLTGIMEDTVQKTIMRIRETVRKAREKAVSIPAPLPSPSSVPLPSNTCSTPRRSWPDMLSSLPYPPPPPPLFYNPMHDLGHLRGFQHQPIAFSCPQTVPSSQSTPFYSANSNPFHQFFSKKVDGHPLLINHNSPLEQTEALPLVHSNSTGPRRKRTKVTDTRLSPRNNHRCSLAAEGQDSISTLGVGCFGPGFSVPPPTSFSHDDISSLYSLGGAAVDRLSPVDGCDSVSQDSGPVDSIEVFDSSDPGLQTITLTPVHLRKAKLMFFYTRYPNSALLKAFFGDIKFNKNNTAQLVKWFSNFREFYYIQMEKYARSAINDGIRDADTIQVNLDSELYRVINLHYNRNNQIEVPDYFRGVVEATLREFFKAIYSGKDQEQSWKKPIYKIIARMDQPVPEFFKSTNWMNQLTDS